MYRNLIEIQSAGVVSGVFVILGLQNAWHNKSRTVLGIVSMAIAAIVFTSSTTLSQGYPATAYFEARQLIGADLVLLPGKSRLSQEDLASPDTMWHFEKAGLDKPNLFMGFEKERYSYGTLEGIIPTDRQVTSSRMKEVAAELSSRPGVKGTRVRRAMPVLIPTRTDGVDRLVYAFLEARDIASDLESWRMEGALRQGRYLQIDDDNSPVGVGVSGWAGMSVPVGAAVPLQVPRIALGEDGIKYRDYEDSEAFLIQSVGTLGFKEGGQNNPLGQAYANPCIFVSEALFDQVASLANCTDSDTAWGIGVTLDEISALEDIVSTLQREYPDFTVVSVPKMASSFSGGLTRSGVPMDMRKVTEVLAFLTAALLSATNLSVLMLSRKHEIGILRSIGATQGNIATMVITESVWIALVGAILGNLISQPAVLLNFLTNRVGTDAVVRQARMNVGTSMGLAVAAAVLFGFLPLTKALRITPAAVLRGE